MRAYWHEGVDRVSLSEVCRRAGVAKPGVYREFGNEDGLTKAALNLYFEQTLGPVLALVKSEMPFRHKLDELTKIMSADRSKQSQPTWCLMVNMRDCADALGESTREQIQGFRDQTLTAYEQMVAMAKANEELGKQIPTRVAARYIDSQIANASSQQARGENPRAIRDVLKLAFSVFD